MERIAILGPGGVGGFLAAALARAGQPVTLVARESSAEVIARDGLRVESRKLGDFAARPEVATELDGPLGFLVVATKATNMEPALERVRDAIPALVVPLLNGLDHLAVLRERYDDRAVAGAIRIVSDRPEPGVIVQESDFLRIDVASDDPGPGDALERFAELMGAAGIPVRIGASEAEVMWGKLVRLNALACTTSAFDRPLGEIRDDPDMREDLVGCVREGVAVAEAEGDDVSFDAVMAEIEDIHPGATTSMLRDIRNGNEPELDAIAGSVMRAGARHGVPTPTIARLAETIAERAGVPAPTA
jgi:2-dehydropantoate 2-reductase